MTIMLGPLADTMRLGYLALCVASLVITGVLHEVILFIVCFGSFSISLFYALCLKDLRRDMRCWPMLTALDLSMLGVWLAILVLSVRVDDHQLSVALVALASLSTTIRVVLVGFRLWQFITLTKDDWRTCVEVYEPHPPAILPTSDGLSVVWLIYLVSDIIIAAINVGGKVGMLSLSIVHINFGMMVVMTVHIYWTPIYPWLPIGSAIGSALLMIAKISLLIHQNWWCHNRNCNLILATMCSAVGNLCIAVCSIVCYAIIPDYPRLGNWRKSERDIAIGQLYGATTLINTLLAFASLILDCMVFTDSSDGPEFFLAMSGPMISLTGVVAMKRLKFAALTLLSMILSVMAVLFEWIEEGEDLSCSSSRCMLQRAQFSVIVASLVAQATRIFFVACFSDFLCEVREMDFDESLDLFLIFRVEREGRAMVVPP
ncbi:hypothetical protein DICA1_A00320 [Diutina catenulata]